MLRRWSGSEEGEKHNEQFEALLKEVTNFIRSLSRKTLDSWDAEIKALVNVATGFKLRGSDKVTSNCRILYTPEKRICSVFAAREYSIYRLASNSLHKAEPPLMDLNANSPVNPEAQGKHQR